MNELIQKPSSRRGGRPSKEQAGLLEDKILDAAAALFFSEGYGATSIEEIARQAQISKRTFYARYDGKAAIFKAVVHRVIQSIRPTNTATDQLFHGKSIEEMLRQVARIMLHASMSPESVALYRVVLAEGARFPELAMIMNQQGARMEAITRISELLHREAKMDKDPAMFAAEQFIVMVTSAPQRRALGLGKKLEKTELDKWADDTVDLFLHGCAAAKGSKQS